MNMREMNEKNCEKKSWITSVVFGAVKNAKCQLFRIGYDVE